MTTPQSTRSLPALQASAPAPARPQPVSYVSGPPEFEANLKSLGDKIAEAYPELQAPAAPRRSCVCGGTGRLYGDLGPEHSWPCGCTLPDTARITALGEVFVATNGVTVTRDPGGVLSPSCPYPDPQGVEQVIGLLEYLTETSPDMIRQLADAFSLEAMAQDRQHAAKAVMA